MRKLLSFILVLLFVITLLGCTKDKTGEQGVPQQNLNKDETTHTTSPTEEATNDADSKNDTSEEMVSGDIQLLSCRFADEIRGADGEVVSIHYSKLDGKVYVDLLFAVDNTTSKQIDNSTISGWLSFRDVKTELKYCRDGANATNVNNEPVLPDAYGYVHLFAQLEAEAENEDLTVHYTVNDKEYECTVKGKNTDDPLSAKTQIKAGDAADVPYTDYAFKVLSVGKVENLQVSNQTDTYFSGPFALVKLEVSNNHATRVIGVNDIFAYTKNADSYTRISVDVENEDGTAFSSDYLSIAPGEKEVVYVYAKLSLLGTEAPTIRINIAGTCYYAIVE